MYTRCLDDGRLHQFWAVGCRAAQVGQVAQSWPASSVSRKFQAQRFNQTTAEVSLGRPRFLEFPRKPRKRVHRLEAALSALGEGNPLAKPLCGGPSNCPFQGPSLFGGANHSVQEFRRKSKERVTRVEAVISRALEQKVVFETEVQEGEARLQQLDESHSHSTWDAAASVTELQRRIGDLTRERDSLRAATPRVLPGVWMADGPSVVETVPPILGIRAQSPGWELWWRQLNWQVLCTECSLSAMVKPDPL